MARLLYAAVVLASARALSAPSASAAAQKLRATHNERQRSVFDGKAPFFASAEASTPEVEAVLEALAARVVEAAGGRSARVLDVGSGTGALSRKYGCAEVVGVDLSPAMVEAAAAKGGANVSYVNADVVDYAAGLWDAAPFDAVVFNACFGNVYDQRVALAAAGDVLKPGGVCCVTHPLGAAFVDGLRAEDASVVPHGLPRTTEAMGDLLSDRTFLRPNEVDDGVPFYAEYGRKPYAVLGAPVGLRGPVARGYGRGGKKLGVPTANLPEDLFGDFLEDVQTGVYAAWAYVAGEARPAVVNVGYSPTFVDAENKIKIVEAHLLDYDGPDFYEENMAVVLVAFQRKERKFPDFPTLVANIKNDIAVAKAALESDAALVDARDGAAADFLAGGDVAARTLG